MFDQVVCYVFVRTIERKRHHVTLMLPLLVRLARQPGSISYVVGGIGEWPSGLLTGRSAMKAASCF